MKIGKLHLRLWLTYALWRKIKFKCEHLSLPLHEYVWRKFMRMPASISHIYLRAYVNTFPYLWQMVQRRSKTWCDVSNLQKRNKKCFRVFVLWGTLAHDKWMCELNWLYSIATYFYWHLWKPGKKLNRNNKHCKILSVFARHYYYNAVKTVYRGLIWKKQGVFTSETWNNLKKTKFDEMRTFQFTLVNRLYNSFYV